MRVWKNRGMMIKWGCKPSKRLKEATVGCEHPWEAGGQKTQVVVTERHQEALCSPGPFMWAATGVPSVSSVKSKDEKKAEAYPWKHNMSFWNSISNNSDSVIGVHAVSCRVTESFGTIQKFYSKCRWTQLKLVPPVCPVLFRVSLLLFALQILFFWGSLRGTPRASKETRLWALQILNRSGRLGACEEVVQSSCSLTGAFVTWMST